MNCRGRRWRKLMVDRRRRMFKPQFLQRLAFMGAGLSSEQRMRTAALIFPSSNFEDIAVALALSSMFFPFPESLQSCKCWSKRRDPFSCHFLKKNSTHFFFFYIYFF